MQVFEELMKFYGSRITNMINFKFIGPLTTSKKQNFEIIASRQYRTDVIGHSNAKLL